MSSRQSVWLADARRRGRGNLLELGPADLAFDEDEAAQLLTSAGVTRSAEEVRELVRSTGGWAAGLYLTALALRSGRLDPVRSADASAHPFISQYLRSEVLSQLTPQALRFLRRTAILDVMSGTLCDTILETTGSAQRLESIARTNFFLQPLDDRHEWFRYHTLFRATLLDDLVKREPDIIPSLHIRAADWWAVNGSVDHAIRHAQAGGDPERAGRLVTTHITPAYLAGQLPTIERWLHDLGDAVIERDPALSVLAGWIAALAGRPIEATRWSGLVEHADPSDLPRSDRTPFESLRAMLRAALCSHGVAAMKTDAELAVSLTPEWHVWRTVAVGLLAASHRLQGDDARAELLYGDAIESAQATGGTVPHARSLGHRAILRMDRGDWERAAQDVEHARAIVHAAGLAEYGASAIVFAAAARLAVHRQDRAAAATMLLHASRLRVLTTWTLPWAGVLLRLELADTHLALADPDGAEVLLREIDEILHHRPSLGLLNDRVERLRGRLMTAHSLRSGSILTTAELRILPYLQTHLTLKEIGERLYISRSTVNTEVRSIYRKLAVSSRNSAVSKARELGLLAAQ